MMCSADQVRKMSDWKTLFLETKQAPRKLDIALTHYFTEEGEWRGRLGAYLKQRIRPAVYRLIEEEAAGRLWKLLETGWVMPVILDEAVRQAAEGQKTEMLILLLRYKATLIREPELSVDAPSPAGAPYKAALMHEPEQSKTDAENAEAAERPGTENAEAAKRPGTENAEAAEKSEAGKTADICMKIWDLTLLSLMEKYQVLRVFLGRLEFVPCMGESGQTVFMEAGEKRIRIYYGEEFLIERFRENRGEIESLLLGMMADFLFPHVEAGSSHQLEELQKKLSAGVGGGIKGHGGCGCADSERLHIQKRGKIRFREFLRQFAVAGEEMRIDMESIDYIPYLYGLLHYGNMPFVEPLKYCEVRKLQELVIAIDTSGSCKTATVRRFMEEVYGILSDRENFFDRMNVYILQCDFAVQHTAHITCEQEWQAYLEDLVVYGRGDTDFQPVFRYVENLRREKKLRNLKGLLYFTDGDGIYPEKETDYRTAFIYYKRKERQQRAPEWALQFELEDL